MEHSRFNNLSAEVRNKIWAYTVTSNKPLKGPAFDRHTKKSSAGPLGPPGIAQTCKQIRSECLLMFYANNEFVISTNRKKRDSMFFRAFVKAASHWVQTVPFACHLVIPKLSFEGKTTSGQVFHDLGFLNLEHWKALRGLLEGYGYDSERVMVKIQYLLTEWAHCKFHFGDLEAMRASFYNAGFRSSTTDEAGARFGPKRWET